MVMVTALPSYRHPPVVEVICGVQFEDLTAFSTVHYGRFSSRIAREYPRTEDRLPLPEVFEGAREEQLVTLSLPPLRRVFYISDDENYLLQVQSSRFHANWRRRRDEDEYPRFPATYDRFLRGWNEFTDFLRGEKIDAPKVNQYELTYINHIHEAGTPFPEGIQDQLGCFTWRAAQTSKFLPAPRAVNLRLQFALPDNKGSLHITVSHGTTRTKDPKGVMVMEITARGPAKSDASDMETWLELAHEWIVRGFTDLTTVEAHQRWERQT